jgi:hypothetical protein
MTDLLQSCESIRRDESDVLLRVTAHLFHREGLTPYRLALTNECFPVDAMETLLAYEVADGVVAAIEWSRHGPDYIGARPDGTQLTIEAKGCREKNHRLRAGDAWRKLSREWTGKPQHRLGIAFADHPVYRKAFGELRHALRRLLNAGSSSCARTTRCSRLPLMPRGRGGPSREGRYRLGSAGSASRFLIRTMSGVRPAPRCARSARRRTLAPPLAWADQHR